MVESTIFASEQITSLLLGRPIQLLSQVIVDVVGASGHAGPRHIQVLHRADIVTALVHIVDWSHGGLLT